jgi:hypothetical protein
MSGRGGIARRRGCHLRAQTRAPPATAVISKDPRAPSPAPVYTTKSSRRTSEPIPSAAATALAPDTPWRLLFVRRLLEPRTPRRRTQAPSRSATVPRKEGRSSARCLIEPVGPRLELKARPDSRSGTLGFLTHPEARRMRIHAAVSREMASQIDLVGTQTGCREACCPSVTSS